ncbi:hypothetical protein H0A36_11755 [Endozoicomonas sp. SM1973]|uniref:Uncharacterized protein n=1 Tax=Spartinivicinus marinus TaxID=2994442 RepID=A0A853IBU2_9GAMM|nr:hypothetical protein [Spartinivicinus marinus]MCX4027617.1 hypothetical protein [Spartinivicinus marinus]NYZ66685.1 hypothetical protein [Spartinivicinus marinus]
MEVSHTLAVASNRVAQRPELNQEQQQREARAQQPVGVEVQISREARNTLASQASLATQPLTLSEPPPSAQTSAIESRPVTISLNNEPQARVAENEISSLPNVAGARETTQTSVQTQQEITQTVQQPAQQAAGSPQNTIADNNTPTNQPAVTNGGAQSAVVSQSQAPLNQPANNELTNEVVLAIDIREVIPDADEESEQVVNQNQQGQVDTADQTINVSADAENDITVVSEANAQAGGVTIPNPNLNPPANEVAAEQPSNAPAIATTAEEPAAAVTAAAIDQFRQVALNDQERQIIESFDV